MLWMALTVVPVALFVLLLSVFVRGDPVYWSCIFWLRLSVWGARYILSLIHI